MDRDWAGDLLPEHLQLISKKLSSMSDFLRLRETCKTWRNSLSPPSDLPPLFPWLILPRSTAVTTHDDQNANLGPSLSMYDLSESRTRVLDLPTIQGKRICGSSHGCLVLEDRERNVSLLNPITHDAISLPSLSVHPNVFPGNTKGAVIQSARSFCIKKAILSSNPRIDPDKCFVMALFEGSWETAFCKIGDDCWTTVLVQGSTAPESPTVDIGYHNNRFYAICRNGNAWICNISDLTLNQVRSTVQAAGEPLVCTVEGRGAPRELTILFVPDQDKIDDVWIRVLSEEQQRWLFVPEDLSDCVTFVAGMFHSIAIPAANVRDDGWIGGSFCAVTQQRHEFVGGLGRYRWGIVRDRPDRDAEILVDNPDAFVESPTLNRLVSSSSYLWFTPTFS